MTRQELIDEDNLIYKDSERGEGGGTKVQRLIFDDYLYFGIFASLF